MAAATEAPSGPSSHSANNRPRGPGRQPKGRLPGPDRPRNKDLLRRTYLVRYSGESSLILLPGNATEKVSRSRWKTVGQPRQRTADSLPETSKLKPPRNRMMK